MTVDLAARARRATEFFNETVGRGITEPPPEFRELWTEAPLIVPMRAAMEGTDYSGEGALERFAEDSAASWETLHMDVDSVTELDNGHVLALGRLTATGRQSGIRVDSRVAWLYSFEGDRISAARTFPSEEEARRAAA
jgi:ketosteroid isomerase-like protein